MHPRAAAVGGAFPIVVFIFVFGLSHINKNVRTTPERQEEIMKLD